MSRAVEGKPGENKVGKSKSVDFPERCCFKHQRDAKSILCIPVGLVHFEGMDDLHESKFGMAVKPSAVGEKSAGGVVGVRALFAEVRLKRKTGQNQKQKQLEGQVRTAEKVGET